MPGLNARKDEEKLVAGAGFGSHIHVLGPSDRAARATILLPAKW